MSLFVKVVSKRQQRALAEKAIEIRSDYTDDVVYTVFCFKGRRAYVLEYFLMKRFL